jgi:hypothetical protein
VSIGRGPNKNERGHHQAPAFGRQVEQVERSLVDPPPDVARVQGRIGVKLLRRHPRAVSSGSWGTAIGDEESAAMATMERPRLGRKRLNLRVLALARCARAPLTM